MVSAAIHSIILMLLVPPALGAPVPLRFETMHSGNETCVVDEVNSWLVRLETAVDGAQVSSGSRHRVNRYRYEQTCLRVAPDGRAQSVSRRYLIATNCAFVPDTVPRPVTRKLQGRTVTVTRDHGEPTVTGAPGGDDDASRSLSLALDDDLDYRVLKGEHAVGDEWSLPSDFETGYVKGGIGDGKCRFVGMTTHGGLGCAEVAVAFRLQGTDITGRTLTLNMSGTILWSPVLRRTLSVYLSGKVHLSAVRRQGSSSTTTVAVGTARISREIRWTSTGRDAGPSRGRS